MNHSIYLHIGNGRTVRERDVVGIFDMDTATVSPITRAYLKRAERDGRLVSVREEVPKSFLLVRGKRPAHRVYIAQLSPRAIRGRIGDPSANGV